MTAARFAFAAIACALSVPALADTDLAVGSFIRQTERWDSDANMFRAGAAEGEGDACWKVVALADSEVTLEHISGHYHPWWSDQPRPVGEVDKWFDSDLFREKNPDAPPLSKIKKIFETVPSCPPSV